MKKGILSILCGVLLIGGFIFTEQQFSDHAGKSSHPKGASESSQF
ncbi:MULTISPECIES: hypothetical protein [Virgibacillus]|nr:MULTISPECIES: hypothetical protein [Virgibacillus]MEB5453905.1 hypothetical protein [Virgibacillus pantothenticus]MEB5457631.1 hypothetical protein [Virgibacillus pantothenticus]MEB5461726.1 hypothetical protein [Virgibacillus pantothenticus]MEB5466386.1 hypothetical protein [Virgibacillus pantothenticus]MEB5470270.1 hypothetical protein [Virgibacillus pantothenticus]